MSMKHCRRQNQDTDVQATDGRVLQGTDHDIIRDEIRTSYR